MHNLSIIGKDFQAVGRPLGFVTTGTAAGRADGRFVTAGK